MSHLLAIDQGTTSTRSLLFDSSGHLLATAQREFAQSYPQPGWVEHNPQTIWRDVLGTARAGTRREWRTCFRYHRQFSALASDRRQDACEGRDKCLADHAV